MERRFLSFPSSSLLSPVPPSALGWAGQGEVPDPGTEGKSSWAQTVEGFVEGRGSCGEADGREMPGK